MVLQSRVVALEVEVRGVEVAARAGAEVGVARGTGEGTVRRTRWRGIEMDHVFKMLSMSYEQKLSCSRDWWSSLC